MRGTTHNIKIIETGILSETAPHNSLWVIHDLCSFTGTVPPTEAP